MTTTTDYTRTWTEIGAQAIGRRLEGGGRLTQPAVIRVIGTLDWQAIEQGLSLPMIPGEAIKATIAELRIPKVSHVAVSHELAPYGFYGIEGHYKNGRARVYVVDLGSDLIPVASDFWPAVVEEV